MKAAELARCLFTAYILLALTSSNQEHHLVYGNHQLIDGNPPNEVLREHINPDPQAGQVVGEREWEALKIQNSKAFWNEPKDLLVTLVR
jgi:hypothetical protein